MRVGVDLDGVLFNFGQSVQDYLNHTGQGHLWKSGPNPKPYWDFYKDWGWTSQQFVDMCNAGADAGFIFRGNVNPGAVEAVEAIKEMGHEIIIITDRQFGSKPQVSHRATFDWWKESGFPAFDEIYFSADKACVQTDIFVEDKFENFESLQTAGTLCYLVTRPWNDNHSGLDKWRIQSIADYPEKVFDLALVQGHSVDIKLGRGCVV